MAFPRTPLDMVTEMYVGDWEEVTPDVYNRQPVTIRWGAPNEGGAVEPTRLTQQWNNRSGRYSTRNPLSDLYGLIGRNTPLRFAVRTVVDSFTRTVADGWGETDTGQEWETFSVGGAAADFDVDGSAGTMVVDAAAEHRSAWLSDESYLDVELAVTVTASPTTVDGGAIEPGNLILRAQSVNLYYLARAQVDTDQTVQIKLMHEDTGLTTELASADVDDLTYSGQALRVRAHVEGQVLRAKVWEADEAEPLGWQVTVWDTRITEPGGIGVRNGVASGSSDVPVTFTVDDFEARLPLAYVELSKLPTRWDVSQVDRWVPVEGYGIRRRLGQGKTPLRSAPHRYITAASPSIFWPLEEGKDVASARPAVGTGSTLWTYEEITGSIRFGSGELAPWLPPVLLVDGTFVLDALFQAPATPTTSMAIDVVRRARGAETDAAFGSVQFVRPATNGTTEASYFILGSWNAGAPTLELFYLQHGAGGGSLGTGTSAQANAFWDFQPHHWRIAVTEDGADIDVTAYLDGEAIISGTHSSYGLQAPRSMAVDSSGVVESHFGYFTLWTDDIADVAEVHDAVTGHRGETAGNRIIRLCGEQAIPVDVVGDPDDSEPMGPQGTKALMPLLDECEAADHGRLHEARGAPGLVYRTRRDLYNQSARLTIPFGYLTPFEPVDDDQQVRNDITVKREGGSSVRVVQETGRLSILDPPDGIGPVDTSETLNLEKDDVLGNHAGWLLHIRTWDESRYPSIHAHLTSMGRKDVDLMYAAAAAAVRDRLVISDPPEWLTYDDIDQVVEGGLMTLQLTDWSHTLNTAPFGPYVVAEYDASRYGARGSTLAVAVDSDDTSVRVLPGNRRWTTKVASFTPDLRLRMGGETFDVSSVSNAATFHSVGTALNVVNASGAPGAPTGVQPGDDLIMFAGVSDAALTVDSISGWNRIGGGLTNASIFTRTADGSAVDTPTVAATGIGAGDALIAQIARFSGLLDVGAQSDLDGASAIQSNAAAQDIASPGLTANHDCRMTLLFAYKNDDWTSVAAPSGFTEIGEPDNATAQFGLWWGYRIDADRDSIQAGTIVVTGGGAATSRARLYGFRGLQTLTASARSVNGVEKSHAVGTEIRLAEEAVYGL